MGNNDEQQDLGFLSKFSPRQVFYGMLFLGAGGVGGVGTTAMNVFSQPSEKVTWTQAELVQLMNKETPYVQDKERLIGSLDRLSTVVQELEITVARLQERLPKEGK